MDWSTEARRLDRNLEKARKKAQDLGVDYSYPGDPFNDKPEQWDEQIEELVNRLATLKAKRAALVALIKAEAEQAEHYKD